MTSWWHEVREVLSSLRGFERAAATVAITSLALGLLEGASVTMLVPFLSSFNGESARRLQLIVVAIGALLLLRAAAGYVNGVLSARLQLRVLLRLRESLAKTFYASRYADLSGFGAGRLVNLFSMQTERVLTGIAALVGLLNAVLLLAVYGVALVAMSWRFSLAAAALGAIAGAVTLHARRRIREHSVRLVRAEEDSSRLVLDDAAGLHVIQAYDVGRQRLALHRRVNEGLYREAMGLYRWRSAVGPLTQAIYTLSLLGALLIALAAWRAQLFAHLPLVLAFVFVLHRLQTQFGGISDASSVLAEQEGAALNVFAFLGERASRASDGTETLGAPVSRITVEQAQYRYPDGERVLHGLDLELQRGEAVAVVGASGAGKSTLAQILVRLREPQAGRILLDGVPLDRVTRASLARSLGVVFEDCFVFDESVEWNITLGRDVPPNAVSEAARVARLDEVVGSLPDRYATRVGTRGGKLSAGQRQRLALARALVAGPQILVLDEATSALDAAAERSITESLRERRPNGITLIIAHRLSTVLTADHVAVLDGGRIVAEGRHADLLESSVVYRRLVETQLVERTAERVAT
ncbi:MAG: ABC transporter ATP-binding protein [Gemmatimonadales bacterium]|jgi:subfamily B ATP-binding cassette protein MsbA